ncbi:uncharacterized protein BO97DRAFT_253518 [Aspergillus homomorphus CBS 101889]|uniref:Uncharacterized protein n=1 Tax=Aspergillus homomorphus (strain CBS 101889) TaxID=1450537 RepID=A0A395HHM4_ASPHC|nr:hypothetical protein BO97DRAFT_253518 [Aspergillus homomorphus CBS 101889]RAL07422.1 hypothetical protein BO97DRAFT_253518 [Aspergillus homomorphus CBS 101889]
MFSSSGCILDALINDLQEFCIRLGGFAQGYLFTSNRKYTKKTRERLKTRAITNGLSEVSHARVIRRGLARKRPQAPFPSFVVTTATQLQLEFSSCRIIFLDSRIDRKISKYHGHLLAPVPIILMTVEAFFYVQHLLDDSTSALIDLAVITSYPYCLCISVFLIEVAWGAGLISSSPGIHQPQDDAMKVNPCCEQIFLRSEQFVPQKAAVPLVVALIWQRYGLISGWQ